ncbi:Equilibrative Nucleoside Transporter (ENT) Family [Thraustotheca clavata]|uniref:Equilibrative Nucleoside Transporter (ENT) Family n=1 Tax=Thraustotheca clavata TaxID=74557 RepID=A0A1W0A3T9_9STRA|nr:Equilibrative Nucleoside Transporter (ENT) Family [Thraustotheca clavata]
MTDVQDTECPKERRLLNVLFSLIGIGYLFPFSALTQPVDYWNFLFPDFNIEFAITCTFMYTNLIMLGSLVSFGSSPWITGRIVGGFFGQLIVLVFVPASYFFLTSESANKLAVLGATGFAAVVTAFLDSCVISLASHYPMYAQESLQFGIGLSTLIGSIYRDLTKVIFPDDAIVESSGLYFYTGAVTVALCIVAYFVLLQLPISKRCLHKKSHLVEESPLLTEEAKTTTYLKVALPQPNRWVVLRKCLGNQIQVALVFMCTLALWPPLVTEMKSYNFPKLQASGWWPLLLLTLFSVFDCIGRFLISYRCGLTKDNIWRMVAIRYLMIPCIIASVQGIYFTHDAFSILFVLYLGFTNGYIGSLAIIFVNDCVDSHEKAIAGSFTGFFLNFGLVLGSTLGLGLSQFIHH